MQDTFARARTRLLGHARATIGYLVYNIVRGRLQRTSGKWGGGGYWFWNFGHSRTGGGGVVCESSDVRKFLKKSKFQNFSEHFKVKTRNYNRSRFQYESIHIWRLQQPRRQQISLTLIKNRSLKQGSIVRGKK